MAQPLIMVAPNGARRTRRDHPQVPLTIGETTATAVACYAAGAGALHLHVRDTAGRHSLDAGRYRESLAELQHAVPQMRVQISTEAAGIYSPQAQLACLAAVKPNWASVAPRELALAPDIAARLYATAADQGTELQHILYSEADAQLLARWMRAGVLRETAPNVLLVLGRYGASTTPPPDPAAILARLPQVSGWMLCAFGRDEHNHLIAAAARGGDCRVGFENSLVAPDGQPWRDNAHSVAALCARVGALRGAA